jgi:hypothetical protein
MKRPVSVIPSSSSYIMITTLVYALLGAIFLESDNIYGEKEASNTNNVDNHKTFTYELVSASCKSPCPSDAEMCITMCA